MGDIDIDLRPKAYDEVEHVTFLAFIDCRIVVDNHTVIPLLLFWQPRPLLILLPPCLQSRSLPPCLACACYTEGILEQLELIKKWGPRDDAEGFHL